MPSLTPSGRSVLVIGAGLVGLSCAWLLARRGHAVLLVDAVESADLPRQDATLTVRGSDAALGVLMGRVFHRSSGRGWRLRQRSLELWHAWLRELAARGQTIPWRQGLLLLAADASDQERQRVLLHDPRRRTEDPALALQLWDQGRLRQLYPELPMAALSGLFSPADGQLDPQDAMAALACDAAAAGLERRQGRVEALEPCAHGWRLLLSGGDRLEAQWLVLAAGLGSVALLPEHLRRISPPLQPVLGQALELELDPVDVPGVVRWPGAVVWRGINLIQRAPRSDRGEVALRLWLGASLEPGETASPRELEMVRSLGGEAPDWLRRARLCRSWQGLRARPLGQPAPLLQELGDGLLLAAGHYRNGVLLAPASAEWVMQRIEAGPGTA